LRQARQTGQSSNRGYVVDRQSFGESADRCRLYLLETWANDAAKDAYADVSFETKPQAALDQIRVDHAAGVAPGRVLAEGGVPILVEH
jgi:SRSO17 transposase